MVRVGREGQRSAGAHCTRPPPPPVPLCHESALNPGRELCGRRVPCERVTGLLADSIREYPAFCFRPQRRVGKSSAPSNLSPERCSAGSSPGSRGFEPPLQCHLETCSSLGDEDGGVSRCLPEELSESCLCLQGSSVYPRSLAPPPREEGTGRRYGKGTENVGRDPPSPVIVSPSSSQISLFKQR